MKKPKKGMTTIAQTNDVIILPGLSVMFRTVAAFIEDKSVKRQSSVGIGSPVRYNGSMMKRLKTVTHRSRTADIRRKIKYSV